MKTKFLKITLIFCVLLLSAKCTEEKNDCSECKTKLIERKNKLKHSEAILNTSRYLDSLIHKIPENGNIEQSILSLEEIDNKMENVGRYDVFGDFSVNEGRLTVFIPVTDETIRIKDYRPIPAPNINALLIRISNGLDSDTPKSPITNVIKKEFNISNLGLPSSRMRTHKKIKVIILNENNRDISTQTNYYTKCLKNLNQYKKEDCLLKELKTVRPNEDGGDIITGG